jgi:hypothetical protein
MKINGVVTRTISYSSYTFNENLRIAVHNTSDYHFNGLLSDIRVYDGVLTDAEIITLYNMKETPMQILNDEVMVSGEFFSD